MPNPSVPNPSAPDPSLPTPLPGQPQSGSPAIFAPPPAPARSLPVAVWAGAGLIVVAVVAALILAGHRPQKQSNAPLPLDPYAANLSITGVAMSESTSLSGGKSTFIDGHIHNTGSQTVTGVTVQVFFRNEEGMPPAIETLPLSVVRTREPYVDTQPISAAPLNPGDDRDFRLISETIPGNWNVQLPDVHIVHVTTK